jgi:exodeoxyribonuclease III
MEEAVQRPMKIATWNVNSLRARLDHLQTWLQQAHPDVLGIQETKLPDDEFPADQLRSVGYEVLFSGQKGYNGVAILARHPGEDAAASIPGLADDQRRILAATYDGVRVVDVYVPNGSFVGSKKYDYKLDWLEHLVAFLEREIQRHGRLVLLGDFNIAPDDRDVYNPKLWEGRVLCSAPERQAFRALLDLGLADAFRLFEPANGHYTWWDYRGKALERNQGLRIDHLLVTEALQSACIACRIDRTPRGWEKPSDHAPVVAQFDI